MFELIKQLRTAVGFFSIKIDAFDICFNSEHPCPLALSAINNFGLQAFNTQIFNLILLKTLFPHFLFNYSYRQAKAH